MDLLRDYSRHGTEAALPNWCSDMDSLKYENIDNPDKPKLVQ